MQLGAVLTMPLYTLGHRMLFGRHALRHSSTSSRDLQPWSFRRHLRHRPAIMSLNGRKRAETHRAHCAAITEGCGPMRNLRLVADDFHVINARPAAGEKIEDSTDLVRPIMMCDAVADINTLVLV